MGDWREVVINALRIIAALSAALFAVMALFTEYKKDGKVTRYGRIAVIGIVVSAVSALGTQWAQVAWDHDRAEKAGREAKKQQDDINGQFQNQVNQLVSLNRQMSHANDANRILVGGMTRSLTAQRILLANARHAMLMTAGLTRQERENTGRVLHTMWDDSNRIGIGSVDVIISYSCHRRQGSRLPYLFRQSAIANLSVRPANEAGYRYQLRSLHSTYVQLEPFGRTENHTENVITFDRFFGPAIQALSRPDIWRGSEVSLSISATFADSLADLQAALAEPMLDVSNVPNSINRAQRRDIVAVLPCPVVVDLFVNNRFIVDFQLHPIIFRHNDKLRVTIQSDGARVPAGAFPSFAAH